jgi:hypothetical protein
VPSDLFKDEIRLTKYSFSNSWSQFVWQVPLGLKILELSVPSNLSDTKQLNKSAISFVLWWNLLNKIEQKWFCSITQKTMSSNLRQPKHTPFVFKNWSNLKYYSYWHLIVRLSRVRIAVNARMRFGVFMPKMSPNGRGFESLSGQKSIFPIKYTRNVKSMQNAVKSTLTVIER